MITMRNLVRLRYRAAALFTLFFAAAAPLSAQPSMIPRDLDDIVVTTEDGPEPFTVIRDFQDKNQWYYVADQPRLYERTVEGEKRPEFAVIRYEVRDPANPGKLIQGGLLQFA